MLEFIVVTNRAKQHIDCAVQVLHDGGIIIYPTEGVYGLGCDPFNKTAVFRLLRIKQRDVCKGLILVAANWEQVRDLIKFDWRNSAIIKAKSSLPTTWVFPAADKTPEWITGKFDSVAIRVITHPIANEICQKFNGPIVSTSLNLAGQLPVGCLTKLNKDIRLSVDCVVGGRVGNLKKPTQICDASTGKIIRV